MTHNPNYLVGETMGGFGWRHFSSRPAGWWNPPPPGQFEREQLDWVRGRLLAFRPGRVLEIGIGRGRATPWLQHTWAYVGLEVNPRLLREAAKAVAGPLVLGSGTHLPFRDGAFDAVVAYDVFMHVFERESFLRECRRVLAPGGILVLNFLRRFSPGWRRYWIARAVHPRAMWAVRARRHDGRWAIARQLRAVGFACRFGREQTSVPLVYAERRPTLDIHGRHARRVTKMDIILS